MYYYIMMVFFVIMITGIIICYVFTFLKYFKNEKLDRDIVKILKSSFDGYCREDIPEDITSNKSKIEWKCPEGDYVEDDELIRLRRRFRYQSNL